MVKELSNDQCEALLHEGYYGHLGCLRDGEPYVLPVTYVYKDGIIFSHTYEGEKIESMRGHPTVCLQVERVRAGNDWESVICWGDFEEVTDQKRKHEIELLLAKQYGRIVMEEGKGPVMPLIDNLHELPGTREKQEVIYRINIRKMTGKAQRTA